MKTLKFALAAAGIVLSFISYGQTDSTQKDTPVPATTEPAVTAPVQTFPAPNAGAHYIAVLGYYTSTATDNAENRRITVVADEENPGKIWIEGLATEKIYAIRKPAAGTYKIPVQKTADKSIPEGTLIYDDTNKQINICVGCNFKDENPSEAFTSNPADDKNKSKQKNKPAVISFSGSKTEAGTASR